MRATSTTAGTRARAGEAGYSLVVLMVIITVLNIAVAAALPVWSTMAKREKEEELIFRGLQYAEGIRLFQQRFGRLPVRLEELVEVEPRCMRQLWKDPMTDGSDWGLVVATGRGGQAAAGGGRPPRGGPVSHEPAPPVDDGTGTSGTDAEADGGPQIPKGPIIGVYSTSTEESLKVFFGRTRYDQWQFTLPLIQQPSLAQANPQAAQGHVNAAVSQHPRFNLKWLGRPFREGIEAGGQAGGNGLPPSTLPRSDMDAGRPGR